MMMLVAKHGVGDMLSPGTPKVTMVGMQNMSAVHHLRTVDFSCLPTVAFQQVAKKHIFVLGWLGPERDGRG